MYCLCTVRSLYLRHMYAHQLKLVILFLDERRETNRIPVHPHFFKRKPQCIEIRTLVPRGGSCLAAPFAYLSHMCFESDGVAQIARTPSRRMIKSIHTIVPLSS